MSQLDTSKFTSFPHLSLERMIDMIENLIRLVPTQNYQGQAVSAEVADAGRDLAASVQRAHDAFFLRGQAARNSSEIRGREVDVAADQAWYGLRDAFEHWRRYDPDAFPQAAEAAELERMLLGDEDWGFLRMPHAKQFTRMKMLLVAAERNGLMPRIDALFGPHVMQEIRRTFEQYKAYRQAAMDVEEAQVRFRAVKDDLAKYALAYVLRILTQIDDHDAPEQVAWVERVLSPIPQTADEVREQFTTRGGGRDEAGDDRDEGPPVPSADADPARSAAEGPADSGSGLSSPAA